MYAHLITPSSTPCTPSPLQAEVDLAIEQCVRSVTKLRDMSPLWEMVQEGIDISKIQWSQDH